ncbi:MAG: hypothetical protein GWP08_07055, partial [Nitrospiraceae bacterium]|nr:hypothetical protein [Nitrospiraceae bacterium]
MNRMTAGVMALAVCLPAGIVRAQDAPTLADVMAEIKALRADVVRLEEELARGLQEAAEDYRAENERLRFKVNQLERERDFVLNEVEAENERLRREIRQTYRDYGLSLPPVPTPDRALLSDVLSEDAPPLELPYETELTDRILDPEPGAEPVYDLVAEWGRTPEEAAALGEDVRSLKGMIAVVPAGADDAYLAAVGRMLRQQFDAYDNINAELFDDAAAARDYNSSGVASPEHRVMSVSRHRESGRDVILILRGETVVEVPPTAAEVPPVAAEAPLAAGGGG